jgi:UPF0042 nucleotide-binding protein
MRILLITGLSGAGKSTALKTLEDSGCEAVDNAPLALVPALAQSPTAQRPCSGCLAIGADVRGRDFSPLHVREALEALQAQGHETQLLFFDCDDEVLQRRFTETRRRHPLALDRTVADGIRHERELLKDLRLMADLVFDTSRWTGNDLRAAIRAHYAEQGDALSLFLLSFSFRHGIPREADMVFDVRFLRNPHYDTALRAHTGLEAEVAAFIEADPDFGAFFAHLDALILPLLPRFHQEGKSYLTIAIGCTGGQHRSVFVAEKLGKLLREKHYKVDIRHRDL